MRPMKSRPKISTGNRRGTEAEARVSAILRAAYSVFRTKGYERAGLNDVIAKAGGSKATLRKYFGSKAGLFAAVVTMASEQFVTETHFGTLKGPPRKILTRIGETVLHFYLDQSALVAYRGVVGGGYHESRMARAFYAQGHARIRSAVAECLDHWHADGLLSSSESVANADIFLHMLRAGCYEQVLLGVRKSAASKELTEHVRRAVHIFLGGLTPTR